MKRSFFQAAVVSILLYGCTTWTLTKRLKKKLEQLHKNVASNIEQVLAATPYKTPTIRPLASHHENYTLDEPDTQDTAREARTNSLVMYSYGSPAYGQAKVGRPARTYIQQLCEDTGCSPKDLPKAMNDWEKWRERVRDIHASGTTWWWW